MRGDLYELARTLGISTEIPANPVDGQMYVSYTGENILICVDGEWQALENAKTTMEYMATQQLELLKNFSEHESRFQQVAKEL